MTRSTKAALLSGLVFPGAGHFYLRKYVRGILFASVAAVLIYLISVAAWDAAYDIMGQIQSGDVPADVESISEVLTNHAQGSEESMSVATTALLVLWVIGIVDAYREGRM